MDRFVLRSITDEIMYEIMLSSEQEYVDEYAYTSPAGTPAQQGQATATARAASTAGAASAAVQAGRDPGPRTAQP